MAQSRSAHERALSAIKREKYASNPSHTYRLFHQCLAELVGVALIVIFGVGSVCNAVLTGYNQGALWDVAVVWGFGVALAITVTASISDAHLNPAVSLALAVFRPNDFPISKLPFYWIAQYLGGVLGGALNLMVYGRLFDAFERNKGIIRGSLESVETAAAFGEYFPNPGFAEQVPAQVVNVWFAMFIEAWGTGILMFVILAVTDPRQKLAPKASHALLIGFTVAVLITLYAPLTQAGWNPARDFGPRIVAALAGWGRIAIPGPRGGFWVYIIGPKIGAIFGALLYDILLNPALPPSDEP